VIATPNPRRSIAGGSAIIVTPPVQSRDARQRSHSLRAHTRVNVRRSSDRALTEAPPRSPGVLTITAFLAATVIGGVNFVAVLYSNRELQPFWGAGFRFVVAGLLFVVVAIALRLRWPRGRVLWLTVWYGVLSFTISYALVYWALLRVSAGATTVVLAVVPLLTLLLAVVHGLERLTRRAVAGALTALAGLVWMALGPGGVVLPLTGLLAILGSAVAISESVILAKRIAANHPAMTNAVAMTTGSAGLLVISLVVGEQWSLPRQPMVASAFIYLATVGSVGLFVLVLLVIRRWTASSTSYMFVLFPVVTFLLAAWLADEPITVQGAVGAIAVIAGVWFGALSPAARQATAAASTVR